MLILAVDLSQRVGWALGDGSAAPSFGVWILPPPGDDLGVFGAAYENELIDLLEDRRPDRVVTAASLPPTAQTHALTMEAQVGLLMLTRCACYRHRVQHVVRPESTARKRVIGTGRPPRGEAKRMVVDWCHSKGWMVPDHNAGDAVVLWQYECWMQSPRGTRPLAKAA